MKTLTSLSSQVQVSAARLHFLLTVLQLCSVFSAHCCNDEQLPAIQTDATVLKKQTLRESNAFSLRGSKLRLITPAERFTSASSWAAAMHLSAASLVLNWANAQPGRIWKSKKASWTGFLKQQRSIDATGWLTFRMICVWIENDLDIVELSVPKKNFFKAFLIRVKGQVSKCEINDIACLNTLRNVLDERFKTTKSVVEQTHLIKTVRPSFTSEGRRFLVFFLAKD